MASEAWERPGRVVEVHNLATQERRTYVGITAERAVICAYAQERNDWSTWDYGQRYGDKVFRGKRTVACGDWCARES